MLWWFSDESAIWILPCVFSAFTTAVNLSLRFFVLKSTILRNFSLNFCKKSKHILPLSYYWKYLSFLLLNKNYTSSVLGIWRKTSFRPYFAPDAMSLEDHSRILMIYGFSVEIDMIKVLLTNSFMTEVPII